MKLTVFLLFSCVISLIAGPTYSQDTKISLEMKDATLSNVLAQIEEVSEFYFLYNSKLIAADRKVDISEKEKPIKDILKEILPDNINVVVSDRQIVLTPMGNLPDLELKLQQKTVTGVVTDASSGDRLPGVTVLVKGTNIGMLTGVDGAYSINVPQGAATLVFSFVGYERQEIEVGDQTVINIVLKEEYTALDEVVVIGYGTQKKSDVTGAISQVRSEAIVNVPVAAIDGALQGRASGVFITNTSGSPGADVAINVRGIGSVNNANNPLYVVDGVPVDNITYLNPSDIESVEILKDASAAIYGSRASNGVVLVTTKQGLTGSETYRSEVGLNVYYGVSSLIKEFKNLDAPGYIEMVRRAYRDNPASMEPEYNDPESLLDNIELVTGSRTGTIWSDEIFVAAPTQSYDLSYSGGSEKFSVLSSLSYFDQDGIVKYTGYKRLGYRLNTSYDVNKRVHISSSLSLTHMNRIATIENQDWRGPLNAAYVNSPLMPVYRMNYALVPEWADEMLDGYYPDDPYSWFASSPLGGGYNPIGVLYQAKDNYNKTFLVNARLTGDFEIIKGLVFRTNLGLNISRGESFRFTPEYKSSATAMTNYNSLFNAFSKRDNWIWENTLNYNKTWEKSNISAVVGITAENWDNSGFTASKSDMPTNDSSYWILDAATILPAVTGYKNGQSLNSYLGRVIYSYDDRYVLTATLRRDGSSKFVDENRWGTFPSGSFLWRFTQENFWKNAGIDFINSGKIRLGWGQLGNQLPVANYSFLTQFVGGNNNKAIFGADEIPIQGYGQSTVGNRGIKWETSEQTNVGLDLAFFNERVTLTVDYYHKLTKDMLLQVPVPVYLGWPSTPWSNAGKVRNSGFEFNLGFRKATGSFTYDITGNITTMKNEVLSLGSGNEPIIGGNQTRFQGVTITRVGDPIGSFYGFVMDGIFQNQEEVDAHPMSAVGARPGDLRFKDLNDDGILNDDDRTIIGSPFPDVFFGLNMNARYKAFDMVLFFQGQYGNEIFNTMRIYTHAGVGNYNSSADILEQSWRAPGTLGPDDPGNPSNTWFQMNTVSNYNVRNSDWYIQDGSYVRLKNFQFGYTLPRAIADKISVKTMRVYVGAQNLLTFSSYEGLDPEIAGSEANAEGNNDPTNFGIDRANYPQARTIMVGMNLNF